jgi:excisionase family DNA binding protein
VDVQSEREAEALAWFVENLGQPQPVRPHVRLADLIATAEEIGHRPEPPPHYPRRAMVRRWQKILDAIAAGGALPRLWKSESWPTRRAERAFRSALVRQGRADRLKALASIGPDHPPVTIGEAAKLLGLSKSGTEKVLGRGALRYQKQGRRTLIDVADVAAFLRTRPLAA